MTPALATAADTYEIEPIHTQILFFVDHFGFSKSQGEFLEFEGQISLDKRKLENTRVDLTIYTSSIDMDDLKWNKKMLGKDYFNAEVYPTMEFESTRIEMTGETTAKVFGMLTLLGNARQIELDMKLNKTGINIATGRKTAGFSGRAVLYRSDFGMNTHLKYIGDEVEIRLEVEASVEPVRKNTS